MSEEETQNKKEIEEKTDSEDKEIFEEEDIKTQKKKAEHKTDNPYENKEVEEMLENDEIDPKEAGFMEGYNEKQSKNPRKRKDIIQDDSD